MILVDTSIRGRPLCRQVGQLILMLEAFEAAQINRRRMEPFGKAAVSRSGRY